MFSYLDPVILIDYGELSDKDTSGDDLQYLAQRFPNMSFVIRRIMYPSMPFMVEAMYQAKNIYAECSWFHTRNAVTVFCRHFGVDRILFSLGKKGNGGAAMAAVSVGGGAGGGVSISPVAFMVVGKGQIRLLPVSPETNIYDRIIDMVPVAFDKIVEIKDSFMSKKNEQAVSNPSDFSAE